MSQFEFRLQSLLKLRLAERQQRRAELAEAHRAQALLTARREAIRQEIGDMRKRSLAAAAPGRIRMERLVAAQRYHLVLREKLEALSQQQSRLDAEIERRRVTLVEADRQVRVLEKLRDRHLEAHRTGELRREVKTLDEVALNQRRESA